MLSNPPLTFRRRLRHAWRAFWADPEACPHCGTKRVYHTYRAQVVTSTGFTVSMTPEEMAKQIQEGRASLTVGRRSGLPHTPRTD